ncbi:putative uncharacterized protein DDB_G0286901 [Condylostylus longicornis]|uniref:putative uncharacterized protein DDB_G0286901 n=1 Tax=Condylostylus longicornis TaxID=2530218 RepID=UPI00244E0C8D|nr:putative uncharacterized protein DDB_G0286901 [Condylostylus longicornis]
MVKLSYYFPVSSDSISLKKQLLESGVLDITNETMYRMAPEAVDPSILSRGSLSHRRYTRSALMMLRDDKLSKEIPNCIKNSSHLLKFPFWKLDNKIHNTSEELRMKTTRLSNDNNPYIAKYRQHNNNSNNNINIKHNNNINLNNENNNYINNNDYFNYNSKNVYNTYSNRNFSSYNYNSNSNNNNNFGNQSSTRHFLHKNHKFSNRSLVSNESENIQLKFDCHEGRFIEKYDCESSVKRKDHSSGNSEQKNSQYSYMIPNFIKNNYDRINKRKSDESIMQNGCDNNNENFTTGNKSYNVDINLGVFSDVSRRNDNEHKVDCNEEMFSTTKTHSYNGKHNENQRYGSGRISLPNKNWNYTTNNIDTDSLNDMNNKFGKLLDNNNSWTDNKSNNNNNIHKYNRYNYNESDYNNISSNNITDKINQTNLINRYNQNHHYKINANNHNYSRYRKESFSSSNHSCNSEEPEWLNCGPISQNDIIELKGFDDDPASDKEDDNCETNQKIKKIALENEKKEDNFEMHKFSEGNCSTIENRTKNHVSLTSTTLKSACNDEVQSVCTSTAQSPPPARSTPTKLLNLYSNNNNKKWNRQNNSSSSNATNDHNKKNYYSLQFSFDNFLDYDTLNNMFGGNSKSRSNHWFKNHHNGSFNNDTRHKQNYTVFEKKNHRQHEQFPKNVINVKDLEDQMRKIGYYRNFQHQGNDIKTGILHQNLPNFGSINQNKKQPESPIKPSVNAFTQCAYQQMLAQANLIVKQTQDPEAFRQFLEQINSVNQLAALSQVSKPFLNFQPFMLNNNGGVQKRMPSAQELECHTRNIVQNALFRKHLQEQQKLRLQELISLQSNINPNAPEFTPTSGFRKISSEKENFNLMTSVGNNLGETSINNFNFQNYQAQNHQYQQALNQQNCNVKVSSILNKFNDNYTENGGIHIKTGGKHIKWNNDQTHYIPNKKYMGRPILKSSNKNSTLSESKLNNYHQSILKQPQNYHQKRGDHYGFDYFLKTKYNNNDYFNSKVNEPTIPLTSTFPEENCFLNHNNNDRQSVLSQNDIENIIEESKTYSKVESVKIDVKETEKENMDSAQKDDNIKEQENEDDKDNKSDKLSEAENIPNTDLENIPNTEDLIQKRNDQDDMNTKID